MKVYISILCLVLFMRGLTFGLVAAEMEKVKNACLKKSGASEDTARKLVGMNVLPDSHVESCFLTCFYKGIKLVSPDNKFVPEVAKKIADDLLLERNLKIAYQIFDICSKEIKVDAGDKCSIGASLRNCTGRNGIKLGFFPHM